MPGVFLKHICKSAERTTLWKKIVYSSNGDLRINISHPSGSSRLWKVENELNKRKITFSDEEDKKKIKVLKKHFLKNKLLVQELAKKYEFLMW